MDAVTRQLAATPTPPAMPAIQTCEPAVATGGGGDHSAHEAAAAALRVDGGVQSCVTADGHRVRGRLTCHNALTMDRLIRPVFSLQLGHKISAGLVAVGKFDGAHPCLTAATTADKVLIHSPHRRTAENTGRLIWSESNREIATLNINQAITCLCAGQFLPNDDKDILIIGTATHILAYHVHDNRDVFYRECPDAVKAVNIGLFNKNKHPILFVGGNSSVHGYDANGVEVFWTAIGDVVTSLILLDYTRDNINELLVSSEDYNIRVFKDDQMIAELTETEAVTALVALPDHRFAYAVANGTIGVYEQDVRLWRVKSKNFAVMIYYYDLLGHGSPQLITGWSNGKMDCRTIKGGDVMFKDAMKVSVGGIVEGDYRSNGKADLIALSVDGEVRGYMTTKTTIKQSGAGMEQDTVRELLTKKQALMLELKHYENNARVNEDFSQYRDDYEDKGYIPSNTRLQIAISANDENPKNNHIEIYLSTNNETIIRAVIVFAEGIFEGETHVEHPPASKLASDLSVAIYPPRDNPIDMHIKAFVGFANSTQFHVFEITRQLPRFAMYTQVNDDGHDYEPASEDSFVSFKVNERVQRICMWINQNFLLPNDIEPDLGMPDLKLHLKALRDNSHVLILFAAGGKITLYTKSLLLASDLVQSLATFLNLDNLESYASFKNAETELSELVLKLKEIQESRLKLGTDIADRLSQIRNLVVRAEDCRINSISDMPKYYNQLNNINKEMIHSHNIRLANYNEGVDTMKQINYIIQRASRLRVGKRSSSMIAHCRNALKNDNISGLINIIRSGEN